MLKGILAIVGVALLLPIAITVVAAVVLTLIGGYIWFVLEFCGWLVAAVLLVIGAVHLIKYLAKKV